jgi:hypothetical protein
MRNTRAMTGTGLALVACLAPTAIGDVIYETDGPWGGPFGLWGPDVCMSQSVALRFTPDDEYTLDRVSVWFMNNSTTAHPLVEVTLRPDDDSVPGVSVPGTEFLERWGFNVSAVGWNPVLEVMDSVDHPRLEAGVHYWIVCESQAACGADGVWNFAAFGTGFTATSIGYGQPWQPGGSGAVVATIIDATSAACPWDLDGGGTVGVNDFLQLLAQWGPCPPACPADFDGDGSVGVNDFLELLAHWGPCP